MTINEKLFGFSIPTTSVSRTPKNLAESIRLDSENLERVKIFFEKIITANDKNFLLTVSANSSDELDSAIEYIHEQKEKSARIAIAPRLWWTKNESSSYVAKYVYQNSQATSANISRSISEYFDINGERKIFDIGALAKKENCQTEFENLITLLDVTRTTAVKANWAIKESLNKVAESVKLHEIAFRDAVNFDVIEATSAESSIRNVSLAKVQLLPSASAFKDLFEDYMSFANDTETSINIFDKGKSTQVVRLISRPKEKIFYTGVNGTESNSQIDSNDFATGFDVFATRDNVKVMPSSINDQEGKLIGNAVAFEMLKQIKEKMPEIYSELNAEAHKVYLVNGYINSQQAMSLGNMVSDKVNTIFNEHDMARVKASVSYYESVAAQFMQSNSNEHTSSMG